MTESLFIMVNQMKWQYIQNVPRNECAETNLRYNYALVITGYHG